MWRSRDRNRRTTSRPRRRKTWSAGLVLVAIVAIGATGCGSSSNSSSTTEGRTTPPAKGPIDNVTWNLPYGEPPSLDYIQDAYYPGVTVITNLCDQLYKTDQRTGKISPDLATAVKKVGDKQLIYTIRSGVKFWDGSELTPKDVVASLLRSQNNPASGEGAFFRNVSSIQQTGAHEVTVNFSQPDPMFEKEMQSSPMGSVASAAYMSQKGASFGTPTGGIMCSGPYKLTSWEPGNQIVTTANPDYWDKSVKPLANTVTYKFVANSTALVNGLSSGDIDGSFEVPPAAIPKLQSTDSGRLSYGASTQNWMIIPISGPMSNADVRRALSLSLDRKAMLDSIFDGKGNVVTTFEPPTTWGYARDTFESAARNIPGATPNIDEAKQLVAQAGPAAQGPIVMAIQSDSQVQQQMAIAIQAAAKEVGLNVQIKPVSAEAISNAELQPEARKGFDALLFDNYFNIPDPLDEAFFFVGSDTTLAYLNLVGYHNDAVNKTLDASAVQSDPQKRAQLYTQAEAQWIGKDQALIPLVNPDEISYGNNRITGYPTVFPYYGFPWAAFVGAP